MDIAVSDTMCRNTVRPDSWTFCTMPPVNGTICGQEGVIVKSEEGGKIVRIVKKVVAKRPKLKTLSGRLVQMRRAPRVHLRCGQQAVIIPGTNVLINCGALHYPRHRLSWQPPKNQSKLFMTWRGKTFDGRGRGRIFVDRKGRLHIHNFKSHDTGLYRVYAGNVTAYSNLKSHSAYSVSMWSHPVLNSFRMVDCFRFIFVIGLGQSLSSATTRSSKTISSSDGS